MKPADFGRAPAFNLYLYYEPNMYPLRNWAFTMKEVEEKVEAGEDINTYQVLSCTTVLLKKGYKIYIWYEEPYSLDRYKHKAVEITLGTCDALEGRELRMGHNLPRLITSHFM